MAALVQGIRNLPLVGQFVRGASNVVRLGVLAKLAGVDVGNAEPRRLGDAVAQVRERAVGGKDSGRPDPFRR